MHGPHQVKSLCLLGEKGLSDLPTPQSNSLVTAEKLLANSKQHTKLEATKDWKREFSKPPDHLQAERNVKRNSAQVTAYKGMRLC